ncbi:MAG: alkaline phosphatase [Deltaproteobacteria bacterium]|nr:alkaline phosphatase [Deltaproteobacteria bacterium]
MRIPRILRSTFTALLLLAAGAASALPAGVSLVPPDGARFLEGQRFDVRVEGKGTGPYAASLTLDGRPLAFTSGEQNSLTTDGITAAGWGGFNRRGQAIGAPGLHTLAATFTDATGTVTVTSRIQVVGIGGGRGDDRRAARNLIVFLGDGMGVAHRTAARLVKYGVTGGDPLGRLEMDGFPGTGLVSTHSLNSIVTDSAPGMACYSTGSHANNNQEGVYPAHTLSPFLQPRVEYMGEYLHRVKGTSLGIVTTADVEDATPAANMVHTGNRNAGTGIVDQYLDERGNSGLAVLLGGGRRWFLPAGQFGSSRSASTDYAGLPADLLAAWGLPAQATGAADPSRDLIAGFQAAGFSYADSATTLRGALAARPDRLLGLFGYGNMNVALDKVAKRRAPSAPGVVDDYHAPDQPMLDEMTEAALQVLSRNRHGFVLMVEGAHIDKQSHLMDPDRAIGEVIELDNAVGVARRFADRAGDTVVVVLADHECSGFSLIGALNAFDSRGLTGPGGSAAATAALPSDAAVLDPAQIPGRQRAVGTYDAAGFPRYTMASDGYPATMDVDGKVLVGYGAAGDRYETWLWKPLPVTDSLLPSDIKAEMAAKGYRREPIQRLSDTSGFFVRGNVTGLQAVHTAADIPVSAYSTGSEAWRDFVGVQTNTDVFFKLMRAALAGDRERHRD